MFRQCKIFSIWGAITIISLLLIMSCNINDVNITKPAVGSRTPSPKIVGEWTPEGLVSKSRVVAGTIGKIKGKDYFFLPICDNNKQPAEQTIRILDLKNPTNPVEAGSLLALKNMTISDLQLSGKVLYASTLFSFWIIDVSNPSMPHEIAELSKIIAANATISGNYAYINNSYSKITIVDISDPSHPKDIRSLALHPWAIKAAGSLLFVAQENGDGLHILDISSPNSLKEIGVFANPAGIPPISLPHLPFEQRDLFLDIAIQGKYVYLASGISGMRVVDISNPSSPHEVSNLKIEGISSQILVSGNLAYVINVPVKPKLTDSTTLIIIDISDPSKPREISSIKLPSLEFLYFSIDGDYIYCYGGDPSVVIVDIYGSNK